MRKTVFSPSAIHEYNEWALFDRKTFLKITKLLNQISHTPFEGEGQPEALKGVFLDIGHEESIKKTQLFTQYLKTRLKFFLA